MKEKRSNKKAGALRVSRKLDVPLREVSGICLRRGRNRQMSLIAIGDHVAKLAWIALPGSDVEFSDWQSIDIARFPGSSLPDDDPQIEAVCSDGAGRVLFLQETPARAELIDIEAGRVVASIELTIDGDSKLARSWNDPKGSRGEGAVFLPDGHLLVAKEKDPPALIEFGPKGSSARGCLGHGALPDGETWPIAEGDHRYQALAVWSPDKALEKVCADFSDLEVGPDGALYLLSDQSASIARLGDLPAEGGTVGATASWRIDDVSGKPEGLAIAATGHAIVALDKRKARNNLVLLEPPIAATLE